MNDIEKIITELAKDVDNDKLFSTIMEKISTDGIGKELSKDELNNISKKYGYDLEEFLENHKDEIVKNLYDYINLLSVSRDTISDWLEDWADYDDIALFILDKSIENYEYFISEGYKDGDFIYEEEYDNYMQKIIPVILNYYTKL